MAKRKNAPPLKVVCDYCGERAVLADSSEVHKGRSYGPIWICRPCKAYVGVHSNSRRNAPMGRLANQELRSWKRLAHLSFDPLWEREVARGMLQKAARSVAYVWLAAGMGIPVKRCHIGMFDVEECKRVIEICEGMKEGAR